MIPMNENILKSGHYLVFLSVTDMLLRTILSNTLIKTSPINTSERVYRPTESEYCGYYGLNLWIGEMDRSTTKIDRRQVTYLDSNSTTTLEYVEDLDSIRTNVLLYEIYEIKIVSSKLCDGNIKFPSKSV